MSKHHLRTDKTCQNCGKEVTDRYCSYCGQENTETRQSFGHLVRHFAEDLTHYDGSFWKTIKYLLFRPGRLTKIYLSGKRAAYVAPVKLYIFISFVTFLIPYVMPSFPEKKFPDSTPEVRRHVSDTTYGLHINLQTLSLVARSELKSPAQYDSIQNRLPKEKRDGFIQRWFALKEIELTKYHPEEISERFDESFSHNFPKALFVYMPLFAFVLWLFHGKKRYYYFDHGIFTLHYFSFILLGFTLMGIFMTIPFSWLFPTDRSFTIFNTTISLSFFAWLIYYLFRAHRKMYAESWLVSTLKTTIIFCINIILFFILLIGLGILTVFNMH